MARLSKRLVEHAMERGIDIPPDITNGELAVLLGPTPPSNDQVEYLTALVGQAVPVETMTYARICELINEFEQLRNTEVLERYGWEEGDVLEWNGEHWLLSQLYSSKKNYKIRIELVDLDSADDGTVRVTRVAGVAAQQRNPRTLSTKGAFKIDTTTWPIKPAKPPAQE